MELSLQQRRKALSTKIPDIQQTLSVVKYLQLRRKKAAGETVEEEKDDDNDLDSDLEEEEEEGKEEKLKTLFELNDTLYAEAEVEETGEVGLWLGVSFVWSRRRRGYRGACVAVRGIWADTTRAGRAGDGYDGTMEKG